jgi:hypothetical protein
MQDVIYAECQVLYCYAEYIYAEYSYAECSDTFRLLSLPKLSQILNNKFCRSPNLLLIFPFLTHP